MRLTTGDRFAATVVSHVGIAVKLGFPAHTMLSHRRKAPRAVEPKSSRSSKKHRSTQTWLRPCKKGEVLHDLQPTLEPLTS